MKIQINDLVNTIKLEDSNYSLPETKAAFLALSPDKASFLEITDVYEELIRFSWVANNKWLIDHTVEPNIFHQQRYASTKECLQFIQKIDQEYDIEAFEGFVDVPVGEFTLDEVLSIKATEDELMGKNDTPPVIAIPEPELQMAEENSDNEEEDPLAWLYT